MRQNGSEQLREELELAGTEETPPPGISPCRRDIWSIVGRMTGTTGGHQVPLLAVHGVPIQVHRGEQDRPSRGEVEEGPTNTTPAAAMAISCSDTTTNRGPIGWVPPDIDHGKGLLRKGSGWCRCFYGLGLLSIDVA